MALNLRPGVGERGQRVFTFPISARGDFGLGLIVAGRVEIDATKLKAVSGEFKAQAQCSASGLSGTVQLFDVTSGDSQLLSQAITTDQPTAAETTLALDYKQPRVLEVRCGLDAPGPYTDEQVLILWFAQVELTTVF